MAVLIIASCQNEQQVDYNRYYSAGAAVYQSHCQNCHGDKGEGLAALIPPLTDTLFLKTNKHQIACYLENGVAYYQEVCDDADHPCAETYPQQPGSPCPA